MAAAAAASPTGSFEPSPEEMMELKTMKHIMDWAMIRGELRATVIKAFAF